LGEGFSRALFVNIEECFDESGDIFGTEGAHRHPQVEAIIKIRSRPVTDRVERATGGIFTVGEFRRNVHVPVWEPRAHGLEPGVNARFAAIDFLAAADQTDNRRPILMPVLW
jgi:hypothetical protein